MEHLYDIITYMRVCICRGNQFTRLLTLLKSKNIHETMCRPCEMNIIMIVIGTTK